MSTFEHLSMTRRAMLRSTGVGLGLAALAVPSIASASRAFSRQRVIIVGGGVGGAELSRLLAARTDLDVTVFDPRTATPSLPANSPLAAEGGMQPRTIHGRHIARAVIDIDPVAQVVIDHSGEPHRYDRLVLSPGIGFVASDYDAGIAAWTPGAQSAELDRALNAMPAAGRVAITVPQRPYRYSEGPYLRAARIARWAAAHKPATQVVLLDANLHTDSAVAELAPTLNALPGVEWHRNVSIADMRAETAGYRIETNLGVLTANVLNHIPRQRAADLAARAGLTAADGWCPCDPHTRVSHIAADIHILGDASGTGAKHGRDALTNAATVARLIGQA